MIAENTISSPEFSVIGVSHWNNDLAIREHFVVEQSRFTQLAQSERYPKTGLLLLNTCNRVELYGFCSPQVLLQLFGELTQESSEKIAEVAFVKSGEEAERHLYRVAMGMDSKILGDLQIVKQLKQCYELSSRFGLSAQFHQLFQSVLRCYKRSRRETDFGKGYASSASITTRIAQTHFSDLSQVRVLLIGAGKIGKVTVKNLISYGVGRIDIVNRTVKKAEKLAESVNMNAYTFTSLPELIPQADMIVCATSSESHLIRPSDFPTFSKKRLIVDLGVPRNVDPSVVSLENIRLVNIDTLDQDVEETMEKRRELLPILENMIESEREELKLKQHRDRIITPALSQMRRELSEICEYEMSKIRPHLSAESYDIAQKSTKRMMNKILALRINELESDLLVETV